jgi:hypothetical protein
VIVTITARQHDTACRSGHGAATGTNGAAVGALLQQLLEACEAETTACGPSGCGTHKHLQLVWVGVAAQQTMQRISHVPSLLLLLLLVLLDWLKPKRQTQGGWCYFTACTSTPAQRVLAVCTASCLTGSTAADTAGALSCC